MEQGRKVKGGGPAEAWDLAAAKEKERAVAKGAAKAGVRDVAEGLLRDKDSVEEKINKQRRFVFINQRNCCFSEQKEHYDARWRSNRSDGNGTNDGTRCWLLRR